MKVDIPCVLKCKVSTLGLVSDDGVSVGIYPTEIMILRERIYNRSTFMMSYVLTSQSGLTVMFSWYTANMSTDYRLMDRFDLVM